MTYKLSIGYKDFLVDGQVKEGYRIKIPGWKNNTYIVKRIKGRVLTIAISKNGSKASKAKGKIVQARPAHKAILPNKPKKPVPEKVAQEGDNEIYSFTYYFPDRLQTYKVKGRPEKGEYIQIGSYPRHVFVRAVHVDTEEKILIVRSPQNDPPSEAAQTAKHVLNSP